MGSQVYGGASDIYLLHPHTERLLLRFLKLLESCRKFFVFLHCGAAAVFQSILCNIVQRPAICQLSRGTTQFKIVKGKLRPVVEQLSCDFLTVFCSGSHSCIRCFRQKSHDLALKLFFRHNSDSNNRPNVLGRGQGENETGEENGWTGPFKLTVLAV